MGKYNFKNFKNWCNINSGFMTLLSIVIVIILQFIFNDVKNSNNPSFLTCVLTFLDQKIGIKIYIIIIVFIIIAIYILSIKRKYKTQAISKVFLIGRWKNEWKGDNFTGFEFLEITNEGIYILDGVPRFKIEDFEYNDKLSQIKFRKVALFPDDTRNLLNTLTIINNELLVGTEENYKIKYIRISS
jgi:hypothetical protein